MPNRIILYTLISNKYKFIDAIDVSFQEIHSNIISIIAILESAVLDAQVQIFKQFLLASFLNKQTLLHQM